MKYQSWRASVVCCLLLLIVELGSSGPRTLSLGRSYPNEDEAKVCGTIRDVIPRDSGRFRRILIRNTNNQIVYSNDDARRMTARTKSKLDVLASLVVNEWEGVRVRVTQAWTDQVTSDKTSLHYEGRSVELQTSDGYRSKLGRLAGLAIEAGFDWVEYTDRNYIRASVIPDVCQTSVDLVFVLDGSGSVGESNFNKVKDFVKRVIDFFNIGRDGTHVSVVTYETSTNIQFNLVRYFTKTELRNAVDDIEYRGLLTYTGEALIKVKEDVLTASAGMRNDAGIPKVLLLLTDGHSNGIKPLEPANELRKAGASIFSIGVGSSVSLEELNDIASDPNNNYVFLLSSFNELASFVDNVSSVSCSEGSLIDSCKVTEASVESGSFKYFRTTFDTVTNNEVSIEVRDITGISHLYASSKSKNPGPLDSYSVSNEDNSSPKFVSVKLNDDVKTVYVAVQGQQDNNKFTLSFWDNLFQNNGSFQADVNEEQDAHDVKTLEMVSHVYDLRYTISAGSDNYFAVRKGSNGAPIVSTTRKLDYEKNKQFSVVIEAIDKKNICHKSRAVLLINVLDVNDNAPIFEKAKYQARVSEKAQKGTLVEKVVATNSDSGESGRITYSIKSSSAQGLFSINSDGDVTLQGSLNYETTESYTMVIMAEDNGVPKLSSTVQLEIFVIDINEQPRISCVFTVSEGESPFTKFGQFSSTDPDTAQNCLLQYTIPEEAAKKFTVSSNGDFKTKAKLDRENNAQYVFFVTVTDCGSPQLSDSVRVTIIVSDVNDNSPKFLGPYSVDIKESESPGSRVVQVKATDDDEGLNAQIKYTIPPNTDFIINEETGIITTAKKLDYETQKTYSFTVTARDQGPQGGNSGSTTVTVNVLDVNDNSPLFKSTPYVAVVNENVGRGTPVIDVNATDRDSVCQTSVDLVFVLDGSGSLGESNFNKVKDFVKRVIDFFNIGKDGTHVSVVTYETSTNIEFNLVEYFTKTELRNAVDDIEYRGLLTYTGEALIKVKEDVLTASAGMRNDAGIPKVLLLLTDGHSNGIKPLEPANELRKAGVSIFSIGVGSSVPLEELNDIASDPDDNYVFTLSSFNELASFVDNVSSVLCSEGSLIDSCKVAETSVESGSFKYFRTTFDTVTNHEVSIEVRDVTGISHLYASSKSKNPGPLDSYSVSNEDNSSPKFVSVKLNDDVKTVYVAVQGQQDNNKFTLSFWDNLFQNNGSFQADVTEEQDAHDVKTLEMVSYVYDLRYTISAGDNYFAVRKRSNGAPIVSTARKLDYEKNKEFRVVIEATDKKNICHKSRAVLTINVLDVNDNKPIFQKAKYQARVSENAQKGTLVEKVVATDLDSGENGRITYSIESSTAPGLFSINSDGDVTLQGTLNYETQQSYRMVIKAEDNGVPKLSSTVEFKIFVSA